jgi:hypothetical protein
MIGVSVGATVKIRCGRGEAVTVQPAPNAWIGSGSIIHPDGWVVTNGHVVRPYQEKNEDEFKGPLRERAVEQACRGALEGLVGEARAVRIRALAADPASRDGITIEKKLQITMSNGKHYPAVVKTYSPPVIVAVGTTRDASGVEHKEYGKDVAILKFEAHDLPVVRLAKEIRLLHIGQELIVLGFPGAVADHELLSRTTTFLPSVTFGRVSGIREDVAGRRVIQTDASIIHGNSGGPVINLAGEAIGAATFTSYEGNQVVQGFNFLIPVETIWDAARQAGVTPQAGGAVMALWDQGIQQFQRGNYRRALTRFQAADHLHPGLFAARRVTEDIQTRLQGDRFFEREIEEWMALAIVVAAGIAWFGGRFAWAALLRRIQEAVREEFQKAGAGPR